CGCATDQIPMRLVPRTWTKGDSSSDGHAVRPARATKAPRTHRTRTWPTPRALRSSSSDPDEALSHRLAADRARFALANANHSAGHLVTSRLTVLAEHKRRHSDPRQRPCLRHAARLPRIPCGCRRDPLLEDVVAEGVKSR